MSEGSLHRKVKQALTEALGLPDALGPGQDALEVQRRLDAVLEGLSAEQQGAVLAEVQDARVGRTKPVSNLTQEIIRVVADDQSPAVMHPEVAQVYIEHPDAAPLHDCADCGLGIPCHAGIIRGGRTIPFRRYFDRCPSCGGRVGYYAYLHQQRGAA